MYSFESRVRYSESDEQGQLSLYAMMNYLQDCSTFQSEHLGVGLAHLRSIHLGWIVGTWRIEIESLPRFAEPITISTWAYALRGFQAKRNFEIRRADGTPCVKADSLWFTFDLEEQRVINVPESEKVYLSEAEPRLEMGALPRRIKPEGEGTKMPATVVTAELLDTNRHMNNANYVLLALAALDRPCLPHVIEVQYKQAATAGDTVVPYVHAEEGGHTVSLEAPDGTVFCAVRFQKEEMPCQR